MITRFLTLLALGISPLFAGLTFDATTLDIPAEAGASKATATFTFTNTDEDTVTITSTKSSCGCTVPELEKKTYAPGEAGSLKAVFTFGDRVGEQVKHITVVTDQADEEGNAETHRLTLKTTIPVALKLTPKVLFWRKGDTPTSKEISLQIGEGFAEDASITVGESPELDVRITHEDGATTATLTLTPKSTKESLRLKLPITLTTGEEPDQKTFTEHVFVLIR